MHLFPFIRRKVKGPLRAKLGISLLEGGAFSYPFIIGKNAMNRGRWYSLPQADALNGETLYWRSIHCSGNSIYQISSYGNMLGPIAKLSLASV